MDEKPYQIPDYGKTIGSNAMYENWK